MVLHKFRPQENILFQKDSRTHIRDPRASRVTRTSCQNFSGILGVGMEGAVIVCSADRLLGFVQHLADSAGPAWLDQLLLSRVSGVLSEAPRAAGGGRGDMSSAQPCPEQLHTLQPSAEGANSTSTPWRGARQFTGPPSPGQVSTPWHLLRLKLVECDPTMASE